MSRKTLSHKDYTIGWISPIDCEHVAARAMLDGEEHSELPIPQSDRNAYTLGSMGGHNVVIAPLALREKGNNPSGTVAHHMMSTFSAINIFFVVGIAGSASKEARLGDVVISTKFVKRDAGKYLNGGRFEHNGIVKTPPERALKQMSKFQATDQLFRNRIVSHSLANMARKFPDLAQYTDSSTLKDVLFRSEYTHVDGGDDCRLCDPAMAVERAPRAAKDQVTIHYGLIASGDQVIKDALERDRINERFKHMEPVICLEMEAAGLMDRPLVVIRGISDYADSHKNDAWQKYAAAVAAACAKEFLVSMPPHVVEEDAGKAGGGGDGSAAAPEAPQSGGAGVEEEDKSTSPPAIAQWQQIPLRRSAVTAVALSHDSKLLAAGVHDRHEAVLLWDTTTWKLQKTLLVSKLGVTGQVGDYNTVKALAFSRDSKLLAWGLQTSKWNIELCDLATGTCKGIRDGHRHWGPQPMSLAFSQDSKTLLSAAEEMNWIFLFDTTAAQVRQAHMPSRRGKHSIAFSDDARTLASVSKSVDGKIELWDTATGWLRSTLEGHGGGVSCVAFSRDSRMLASGSRDGKIRLWDAWTGQLRKTMAPQARQWLRSLAFMHDFTLLSSTLRPQTIELWDVETGQLQQTVPVNEDVEIVSTLLVSHDSRFFVSASTNRRSRGIRIWSQEPGVRGKD